MMMSIHKGPVSAVICAVVVCLTAVSVLANTTDPAASSQSQSMMLHALEFIVIGVGIGLSVCFYWRRRYKRTLAALADQKREIEIVHAQLNTTLNALPHTIFEIDRQGRIYLFRAPDPDIFPVPPREFMGRTIQEMFPQEAAEIILKTAHAACTGAESNDPHFFLRTERGVHWFELSAMKRGGSQGEHERCVMLAQDITARRQAEENLRLSEERYRTLQANVPVGVFRSTTDGRVVSVNAAVVRIFGYESEEEILGMPVSAAYVDPRDRERMLHHLQLDGTITGFEVQIRRKDGELAWLALNAQAVRNGAGEVEYIDGVARDITERRMAEEALRQSEKRFRSMVDSVHDGVYSLDRAGYFTFVNGAIADRAGIPKERFASLRFTDIILPEYRETAEEAFIRAIEGRGKFNVEFSYRGADGQAQYVETTATQILDNGRIIGLNGVTHNVTQHRLAQEQLRQAHWELQMAHEELEQRVRNRTVELTEANRLLRAEIAQRNKVEEALRDSEKTLRAFLDALPEPALLMDRKETILAVNQALAGRHGRSQNQLIGQNAYEFLPPDIARGRRKMAHHVFSNGTAVAFEDSRDGRDLIHFLQPIFDSENTVVKVAIFALDITDRKQAERALRESEERYRSLLDTSNSLILCLDSKVNITVFNREMERVTGYSREEVLGRHWPSIFLPPEFHHEGLQDFARWVREHPADTYEGALLTKSGERRTILWSNSAIFMADDWRMTALAVGQDITDRKRTEEALKFSEEKYRLLMENVPAVIAVVDADGRFLFANDLAAQSLGKSLDQIIGASMWEIFPEGPASRQMENIRRTIMNKQEISVENQTIVAGRSRWYYTNLQPYRDAEGAVTAALVIATDITERKEASERLLAAQQEKYRQAKEIAGGVAHEIHNALCPATNALEKLKERLSSAYGDDGRRNQSLLDLSEAAVYNAMNMTQLVTTYSRLEAEKMSPPVSLSSVIADVVRSQQLRIDQMGVMVTCSIPAEIILLLNPAHAFSVFNNLLINALDAMEGSAHPEIRIGADNLPNGGIRIRFSDTGTGMAPSIMPRIFDLFFSTKPNRGSGIGLAMVKKIIELYGAQIEVQSEVDKGTEFTILWPKAGNNAAGA